MRDEETQVHRDSFEPTVTPPEQSTSPSARREQKIGSYVLLECIGEGEFGKVYQAKRTTTNSLVALKILKPPYAKKAYARLQKEAAILQKLRHRALPQWIELGLSQSQEGFGGAPYLVMEDIPGETLRVYLQKEIPPLATALRLAYSLVQGVHYLHTHDIIHRDLKPSNIQVTHDSSRPVCILDFGLAIVRTSIPHRELIGSLRYMSPEQMAGQKLETASDLYAVGLLLYELFSGSYPYEIPNPGEETKVWQELHQKATPHLLPKNTIPTPVAEIILQCLQKTPGERPTAREILAVIEREISGLGFPSYIGILGSRGAGKTCYLTLLYGEVDVTPETRAILEEKYTDLYERGTLPGPTELSTYRLEFQIITPRQVYDVVTKDYGGELLEGRRQERSSAASPSIVPKDRSGIYEFFQSARAILILMETQPTYNSLQDSFNYQYEVYSLLQRLLQEQGGRRKISVPIALVLTKWDRRGDCSRHPEVEKQRALDYIAQTDWLSGLYQKLQNLSSHVEVFPVFSFIGDKPITGTIKPFNLSAPLVWAAEQAEQALWEKCQDFHSVVGAWLLFVYGSWVP